MKHPADLSSVWPQDLGKKTACRGNCIRLGQLGTGQVQSLPQNANWSKANQLLDIMGAWLAYFVSKTCCKSNVSKSKAYDCGCLSLFLSEYERWVGAWGAERASSKKLWEAALSAPAAFGRGAGDTDSFPVLQCPPSSPFSSSLPAAASSRPTLATSTRPGGCPGL